MGLRTRICFELSRRLIQPPDRRTADMNDYVAWRSDSLSKSWSRFDDANVRGKDVLDFGSGKGNLSYYLAMNKSPRRVVGVEMDVGSVAHCKREVAAMKLPEGVSLEFVEGQVSGIPLPDRSFDTLLAFDCVEHIMDPEPVFQDWFRVLRPGGRALVEWFPYRGPWGPHMESLIPIPWAHIVFGQEAMMRTAERIYDLEEFEPRAWDLDENGNKKPNKWRAWSSFREQGYINELQANQFKSMMERIGFSVARFEPQGFGGPPLRQAVGRALLQLPGVDEFFTSHLLIELVRPA